MSAAISSPTTNFLTMLGLISLVFALRWGLKLLILKLGNWRAVAQHFPIRNAHLTEGSFKKQDGVIGQTNFGRGGLEIRIATEGLCLYPVFARRNPCLIPWPAIRRVSVSDTSLLVIVEYENTLEFFLPVEALPLLHAKLSPVLFHQAVDPFAAAKKALNDGTQPAWMSAVAGPAVRLAKNEYEKERRLRGEKL